jgi:heat-inducible transcriptional repressor
MQLSERQQEILRRVVEEYVHTGQPVGSRSLVERSRLAVSPSTVRSELAELERLRLLTHPHTSAGRVPTEQGYRYYADELLSELEPQPSAFPLDLTTVRSEVEAALQATTEMLAQVTRLLALVSAPPAETTTVRHIEVLRLQPRVVVTVVITSTGAVAKRVVAFEEPVDTGLVTWAGQYLNERLGGQHPGTRLLRRCFEDPSLSTTERSFLDALRPVFAADLGGREETRLYVGGAATLLDDVRGDELNTYRHLLEALERRAALLELLGRSLDPRRPYVRVGDELQHPALRDLALVGAAYGLSNRALGSVSLLGPVRMDYDKAIKSVRAAAWELSRFVEGVYDEDD